jgi:hypothetical protein
MLAEEMRLDGNAAGGALRELFARDVTAAIATCAGCGATRPVGALLDYGHPMGVILRCPTCDTVILRLARTPRQLRVDATGIRLLVISGDVPVA